MTRWLPIVLVAACYPTDAYHDRLCEELGGKPNRQATQCLGDPGDAPERLFYFLTRTEYDGDMGGVEGADERCTLEADRAGLRGPYQAFLSTRTVDAPDRLLADGPWFRTSGQGTKVVFESTDEMAYVPANDLDYHANGERLDYTDSGFAWTGHGGEQTCSDWTSTKGTGTLGSTDDIDDMDWLSDDVAYCSYESKLYCFAVEAYPHRW